MPRKFLNILCALFLSVALHAAVFVLASNYAHTSAVTALPPKVDATIIYTALVPTPPEPLPPRPRVPLASTAAYPAISPKIQLVQESPARTAIADRQPAEMAAPPAPTAEEWAFAAKYTNKNSKGYRHSWGQQVRSMMGTAVEGPDQGMVRFRIEISPDGALANLETLWSTSPVAERLARKVIESLPSLPPTPTGKPLIFEKTISFTPFASDGPPVYRDDCLPDPPAFRNPFAWDGKSPMVRAEQKPIEKPDPQDLDECLRQLPKDSIEAEMAQDQRVMDQWGSKKSGR